MAVIDVSVERLAHVHANWKMGGALPNTPMQARSFEFVSALEVIEHIEPSIHKDSLQEISRASSQFGALFDKYLQYIRL